MINIKWIGALLDSSGYASASRSYIECLLEQQGINLSLKTISFEQTRTQHSSFQEKAKSFFPKRIKNELLRIYNSI